MAEEVIGGYRLQNLMMSGQTSQVWEVVEVASSRHFAMKLLLPEKEKDRESRRLLIHEATVGKKLAHPNVIKIVHFDSQHHPPYFVMEFFPAGSLKLRLLRKQYDFIKERIHSILKQSATALAYMNASGWVHRDVKPDNMLVNSAGELKLIDFALAKRVEKPSFFAKLFGWKNKAQGTRTYMSPEQIRGEALDGRADMYSYAISAYELVTYRPPFTGQTSQELLQKHIIEKPTSPQAFNPDLTDDFCKWVIGMLAKNRKDRPPDFHQVLMQLRNIKIFKSDVAQKKEGET